MHSLALILVVDFVEAFHSALCFCWIPICVALLWHLKSATSAVRPGPPYCARTVFIDCRKVRLCFTFVCRGRRSLAQGVVFFLCTSEQMVQLDLQCMSKRRRQQSALVAFNVVQRCSFVVRRHAPALVLVVEVPRALRYELFHISTQIHGPTAFLPFATYGQVHRENQGNQATPAFTFARFGGPSTSQEF